MNSPDVKTGATHGYAPINGLKMYYEMEGTGDPLVCIPPAFGYAELKRYPALKATRSLQSIFKGMAARRISRNARFRSSNTPRMSLACYNILESQRPTSSAKATEAIQRS